MKKTLLTLFSLSLLFQANALHERYEPGFEMLPSQINTPRNETAISFLKDKVVYTLIDSAGVNRIYSANITESPIELENPQEVKELTELGIHGTIAYDASQNKIYFSRHERSTNNYMLFESEQKDENKWSSPRRLRIDGISGFKRSGSALVNAGWLFREPGLSGFFNPTLANGGKRIYFSGEFSEGLGSRDLWYIDQNENGNWGVPHNVGRNVNSDKTEDYPFVSGDSLLYFASNNGTEGDLDLFVSRFEDGAWAQAERLSETYNSSANDYNLIGTDKVLYFVSSRNATMGDDIYRPAQVEAPPAPPVVEPLAVPEPIEEPVIQRKDFPWKLFYFDFDKDVLNSEFNKELDELAAVMLDYLQDNEFIINGHTDSRGSDAYNIGLSKRRANRVYNELIKRGVPADKMRIVAHGKRQLAVPDAQTEEDHARNRRVEVDIVRN